MPLLWKGGVEPPDAALVTGGNGSIATYTGTPKKAEIEVRVAPGVTPGEGYRRPELDTQESERSQTHYSEIIARASARAAEVVAASGDLSKLPGGREPGKPKSAKPEGATEKAVKPIRPMAGRAPRRSATTSGVAMAITPSRSTGRGLLVRNGGALCGVARRSDRDEGSVNVVIEDDGRQRLPILMALTKGAEALELSELPETQEGPRGPKGPRTSGSVIGFPLTEEQQKAEKFYQQTGMKYEDFKEIFNPTPSWSVAEVLSPRLNAEKAWRRICDCRFDAELAACKAKNAVRDFLYKRRPLPTKK